MSTSKIRFLHSFELFKYDVWKQELKKNENGRCKKAHTGKENFIYLLTNKYLNLDGDILGQVLTLFGEQEVLDTHLELENYTGKIYYQ